MTDLEAENAALRHGDELCRDALQRFETDCSTPAFVMARSAVERIAQLEGALRKVTLCGGTHAFCPLAKWAGTLLTPPEG